MQHHEVEICGRPVRELRQTLLNKITSSVSLATAASDLPHQISCRGVPSCASCATAVGDWHAQRCMSCLHGLKQFDKARSKESGCEWWGSELMHFDFRQGIANSINSHERTCCRRVY